LFGLVYNFLVLKRKEEREMSSLPVTKGRSKRISAEPAALSGAAQSSVNKTYEHRIPVSSVEVASEIGDLLYPAAAAAATVVEEEDEQQDGVVVPASEVEAEEEDEFEEETLSSGEELDGGGGGGDSLSKEEPEQQQQSQQQQQHRKRKSSPTAAGAASALGEAGVSSKKRKGNATPVPFSYINHVIKSAGRYGDASGGSAYQAKLEDVLSVIESNKGIVVPKLLDAMLFCGKTAIVVKDAPIMQKYNWVVRISDTIRQLKVLAKEKDIRSGEAKYDALTLSKLKQQYGHSEWKISPKDKDEIAKIIALGNQCKIVLVRVNVTEGPDYYNPSQVNKYLTPKYRFEVGTLRK
jgi:hypothetical protein